MTAVTEVLWLGLLLGQHLTPGQLAGGALVVAGVVLAQLAAARGASRPRERSW